MRKVVWGVLSTAKIGRDRVLPGMMKSDLLEIRAIASRDEARARAPPTRSAFRKAYGSYEALLADPEIEAIYNPLPNHLHVPLTLQAAAAGKHVLCEKPIALTADEALALRAAAGKVLIAEAFMVRFHPQWLRARELVREGRIGTLRAVQMFFGYNNVDPANVRNQADIGGGGLYDIGCYAIVAGRFFFEAEPTRGDRARRSRPDVPHRPPHQRRWSISATAAGSTSPCRRRSRRTSGCSSAARKGRIEIPDPGQRAAGRADPHSRSTTAARSTAPASRPRRCPPSDQYQLQGEAFSRAVRGEIALPYGVDDAIANMRVIDALFRSETSGRWEERRARLGCRAPRTPSGTRGCPRRSADRLSERTAVPTPAAVSTSSSSALGTPPSMMCTERTPSRTARTAAVTRGVMPPAITPSSSSACASPAVRIGASRPERSCTPSMFVIRISFSASSARASRPARRSELM